MHVNAQGVGGWPDSIRNMPKKETTCPIYLALGGPYYSMADGWEAPTIL
jgi:hypothetical protein